MLNITYHQKMQIKTTMRYHLTIIRMAHQKDKRQVLVRMWRKGTLLHCWWKCKLVQPLWKTVWRFLKKIKNKTTVWSRNPTAGIYLKEMKSLSWRDTCIIMFTAALFIIANIWKRPKCPLTNEWKKIWNTHIHTQWKKKKIGPFVTTWMDLEGLMLSEVSQIKTNII